MTRTDNTQRTKPRQAPAQAATRYERDQAAKRQAAAENLAAAQRRAPAAPPRPPERPAPRTARPPPPAPHIAAPRRGEPAQELEQPGNSPELKRQGAGRPPFVPTTEQRRQVESMAGLGIPQAGIASLITNPTTGKGIDEKTLREYFREELEAGVHKANRRVATSLFEKATGNGPQSAAACMFWLKCRAGWRERIDVAVDVKGGVLVPPASMTPEQWIAFVAARNAESNDPRNGPTKS